MRKQAKQGLHKLPLAIYDPTGSNTLMKATVCHNLKVVTNRGAPEGIRTPDTFLRTEVLYPAELPERGITQGHYTGK